MSERRRLAAIVSADVVGYSRLMGRDESGTLAALKAVRRDIVDPQIAKHGGRIVKTTGDGLLLEFPSVVDAVRSVIAVQDAMRAHGADLPEDRRIVFRVGVNLGDIIIEGDDIFGDGVNVAARLQEIAPPGGMCVSSRVHDDVRDRLDAAFVDDGERTLKNIARPVRVWRWVAGEAGQTAPSASHAPLALPDKPSIAVLPFQNMSGDPEQEYFADGMVEDIITGLSRNRGLFVIARNSTFTYKGKAVDVRLVGRELGVRYVLEGSVRKAANRVRITGLLVEAQSGAHLWADRFDGALEDVFDLQDQVTSSVVSTIGPTIERAEMEHSSGKPTDILQAYDLYLRALAYFYKLTKETNEASLPLFRQVTEIDPNFARAFVMLAMTYGLRRIMTWTTDLAGEAALAEGAVRRALQLEPRDPFVLARAGSVLAYVLRRIDESSALFDRALELDPNDAFAWAHSGLAYLWLGKTEAAVEKFRHALRLNPLDPQIGVSHTGLAWAHCYLGNLSEAENWANKALHELPNFGGALRALIAIQGLSGKTEDARGTLARYMKVDPAARVSTMKERYFPGVNQGYERALEGFRLAGMSE